MFDIVLKLAELEHLINKSFRTVLFNTYMHKASKEIIDYCLEHNVKQIIIGHNKLQKQESKLKNFVAIPTFRLIELIKYKAEYQGIEVIETEESYTSITSYLDKEEPIKDNANKARRQHRGLFVSNKGKKINADVNSAYQIMKKVIGDKIMFKYKVGNILDTECRYILNPVNCVGAMGKGLALQIAKKYPESVEPYKKDCRHGSLSIGRLTSFNAKDGKTIINFPTKDHWRDPSKYRYIESGLEHLAFYIKFSGNKNSHLSFAIPPLGCGLGGLKYGFIHELIQQYLSEFKNITFELYVTEEWLQKNKVR